MESCASESRSILLNSLDSLVEGSQLGYKKPIQFLRSALGFIGDVVCQLWIEKRTAPKDTQNFSDGCFFFFLSQNAEIGIRKMAGCCMTKQKLVQSEIQCVLGRCESTRHMTRM